MTILAATEVLSGDQWATRCDYWRHEIHQRVIPRRPRERAIEPIILCGHAVSIRVESGTLFIKNGFTHHPQKQETFRFYKGDLNLPTRIIMLDGSGSISFDVLTWLSEQGVSLIRIDWRGHVVSVLGATGFAADQKKLQWQLETRNDPERRLEFATDLIRRKIERSISVARNELPETAARTQAINRLPKVVERMEQRPPASIEQLRGVEGPSAATYFASWVGMPIKWKSEKRHPVPDTWRQIGIRASQRVGKLAKNEKASHPVNAMLNYGYAVLQSTLQIKAVSDGYDPIFGIMHNSYQGSPAFVFDLMEPGRPNVDGAILRFVRDNSFSAADFMLTGDGICRLGPQLARAIVAIAIRSIEQTAEYCDRTFQRDL